MIFELALGIGITIIVVSFIVEYIDSTLGMGYGTTLTPLLMLMSGFDPLQIVPAILLSQLISGLLAGFAHHSIGNVNFKIETTNIGYIIKKIKELGIIESFKRGVPLHLKITLLITFCSILGILTAVLVAIRLPIFYLKLYIGILVLVIGIIILATINKRYRFSWKKITGLALIASFNKGISGGGYGPIITGGQLLVGIDGKNAIGITSLAEGLTCIAGVITYIFTKHAIDWILAPYLIIGAVLSVPLSAYTVKKIKTTKLKILIGIITIILGIATLGKIFYENT